MISLAFLGASYLEQVVLSTVIDGSSVCHDGMGYITLIKWIAWSLNVVALILLSMRWCFIQLQSRYPESPLTSPPRNARSAFSMGPGLSENEGPENDATTEFMVSPVKSILRSSLSALPQPPPPKSLSKSVSFRKAVSRKNIPASEPGSRNTVPRVIDFNHFNSDAHLNDAEFDDDDDEGF
jgi:hypothetical protein